MGNKPEKLNKSKRLAIRGVMVSLAMILSYLESLIPFNLGVPGAKIGLANTVTILALIRLGTLDALMISIIRVILTTILFGNMIMMIYSLAGAVLSIFVMSLFSKSKKFGIVGISIAGAAAHNAGQCLAAAVLMQNKNIMGYLPILLFFGVIAGLITGLISSEVIKRLDNVYSE